MLPAMVTSQNGLTGLPFSTSMPLLSKEKLPLMVLTPANTPSKSVTMMPLPIFSQSCSMLR